MMDGEVVSMDEHRARRGDPATSHRMVNRVLSDTSLYERIVRAAAKAYDDGKPFTDGWLARQTGRQRNVVARARLDVERDGWLERVGETRDGTQTLFRMKENMRKAMELLPATGGFVENEESDG